MIGVEPNEMGEPAEEARVIRQEAEHWVHWAREFHDDMPAKELIDATAQIKRAADLLYAWLKDQQGPLINLTSGSHGDGLGASDGSKWGVEQRFEVELLDPVLFERWAADAGVAPFDTKVTVSSAARSAVKVAMLQEGEVVPGVSAGMGAPYLKFVKARR